MKSNIVDKLNRHPIIFAITLIGSFASIAALATPYLSGYFQKQELEYRPNISNQEKLEKSVIEGELFQACGLSKLYFTSLHSGKDIASLGRKHGALFDEDGELRRNNRLTRNNPLHLSRGCYISITDRYVVQGHYSFDILIVGN